MWSPLPSHGTASVARSGRLRAVHGVPPWGDPPPLPFAQPREAWTAGNVSQGHILPTTNTLPGPPLLVYHLCGSARVCVIAHTKRGPTGKNAADEGLHTHGDPTQRRWVYEMEWLNRLRAGNHLRGASVRAVASEVTAAHMGRTVVTNVPFS